MDPETQRTLITTIGVVVLGLIGLVNVLVTKAVAAKQTVIKEQQDAMAVEQTVIKAGQEKLTENVNGKLQVLVDAKDEIGAIKEKLGEATGFIAGLKNGEIAVKVEPPIEEPLQVELVDGHEPKDTKDR